MTEAGGLEHTSLDSTNSGCMCCGEMLHTRFDRRRFLQLGAGAGLIAAFPALALAAEGDYEAMLLTCIDPRFPEPTIRHMESRGMIGKYSQFSFAGASIGVVAPAFKAWEQAFWDNLGTSVQLHHIAKVIAMNHRDCGAAEIAYGPDKVANKEGETETHKAALMLFRKQVAERHPTLKVELGLMALDGKVETFS